MNWIDYQSKYFHNLNLTSDDSEVVAVLISSACEFVEKYCNRKFELAEHDKVFTVSQEGSIVLDHPPIVSIDRLCVSAGGWVLIKNTTATNASFSTTDNSVKLLWYAAGVKGSEELKYTDYPTLGLLASAITNIGQGWMGSIISTGKSDFPSSDILAQQYANATGTGNTLNVWCDYSGYYDATMRLPLQEGYYYDLDPQHSGVIRAYFIPGTKVRACWQSGFVDVPEPIKQVVANLVIDAYQGSTARIKTETLGAYSYTLADVDELAFNDKKTLAYWKVRQF